MRLSRLQSLWRTGKPARKRMRVINTRTKPGSVRRHFRASSGSICWPIDSRMSSRALRELIASFRDDQELGDALLQMIACHPKADASVMDELLSTATEFPAVGNAIATSGRAPERILKILRRHSDSSVRDHAELALVSKQLQSGPTAATVGRLVVRHRGDAGISVGVRAAVARSEAAPVSVLKRLSTDSVDLVAQAARETLSRRSSTRARVKRPTARFSAREPRRPG
jgi:hypothetical protein